MDCEITISSSVTDGDNGITVSKGTIERDSGGFRLKYFLGGDECVIIYDGKKFTQSRFGDTRLDITFIEGETTDCLLGYGGGTGAVPVFTRTLNIYDSSENIKIKIEYDLGDTDIRLDISAEIKEKK